MKPKLRFKEFSDDWEEKKLGDIADVTKLAGFEFTKYVIYSDSGNIIALRGLNIKKGKLILDDIKYIDMSDLSKLTRSKLYIGDIIFTYVGTIGECAVINENDKYYLAPNVCLIRVNNDNYKFVQQYISRDKFKSIEVNKRLTITSQPALSMNSIRQFKIQLPSLSEQEKIGTFLSLVDQRIEKAEKKVSLLKEEKKGWMQKLFQQEIRFKDEQGNDYPDWEEKELEKICNNIVKGKKSNEDLSGNLLLTAEYLDNKENIIYVKENINVFKEDILILWDGSQAGKCYIGAEGVLGSTFMKLETISNSKYLYHYLNFNFPIIKNKWRTGSGIPHVSKDFVKSFKIPIPSLPEQEKIADFLSLLDQRIEKEERKVELLKEEKKGLLQNMFV